MTVKRFSQNDEDVEVELRIVAETEKAWLLCDSDDDRKAVHLTYSLPAIRTLYDIKPVFLVAVAEQGQRYFAWGGNLDFYKVGIMSVGIGFHAGFIDRPKGLGHKVEYYSSFYTSYNITNNSSLKAEVGHISNGGFGDKNPGSESLVISFFHSF